MNFLNSMPFLIINLGGEMLYILDQRLKAQQIEEIKARRVLKEITATMFGEQFIDELLKPQKIYSITSTKQVFDKLAHSSIMRLSETSMNKLYDLMLMGFKYEILMCINPEEIVQATLNHLDFFADVTKGEKKDYLLSTRTKLKKLTETFKKKDYIDLKIDLLNFLHGKNVKVGIFLTKEIQKSSGFFELGRMTTELGYLNKKKSIGVIEYFDEKGGVSEIDSFGHPYAGVVFNDIPYLDTSKRTTSIGFNMYSKDTANEKKKTKASEEKEKKKEEKTEEIKSNSAKYSISEEQILKENTGTRELNLLSTLLGGVEKKEGKDDFDLNLFSNEKEEDVDPKKELFSRRDEVIVFNNTKQTGKVDFNIDDPRDENEKGDEEVDLLAMMDSVNE